MVPTRNLYLILLHGHTRQTYDSCDGQNQLEKPRSHYYQYDEHKARIIVLSVGNSWARKRQNNLLPLD